jgi:hypothetical protein
LQTFIRRDGPSVFDRLLPFSVVSWLRQIERMDEGAEAGSRKSTTRSDVGGLCLIPVRY